jgi:hypothetical protein
MIASEMTTSTWRRIVRASIEPHMGLDGVRHALDLWAYNFSNHTDFQAQIRPFVYSFCKSTGRHELRIDITHELIRLSKSDISKLPNDPDTTGGNNAASDNGSDDKSLPAASLKVGNSGTIATFILKLRTQLVLQIIGSQCTPHYDRLVYDFISSKRLKLTPDQVEQWIAWSQSPYKQTLDCNLTSSQCTLIMSTLYVFLTEWFGPVLADDLLDKTIPIVELTPTGKAVSPKLFL